MKFIVIELVIIFLKFIYFFFKLLPINRNKITLISRQSNTASVDFILLAEELKKYKIIILTRKLEKGILNKLKYSFHILIQMYHIATSTVIILDSYCIPVSILQHKKKQKIIQIWHAMGSLKKFGYSILDKEEGSTSKMAKTMKMHNNYNYIVTSSENSMPNFAEAFNASIDKFIIYSLPRVDYLKSEKYKEIGIKIITTKYPELSNGKKNILYVPTFRINLENKLNDVIQSVDYQKFNLIIKLHAGDELIYINGKKSMEKNKQLINSMDFLRFSNYVITDYSAIVYEAAILNKPLYFYAFDYNEYINERGFYLNYKEEMPGLITNNIHDIMSKIHKDIYDVKKVKKFSKKYVKFQEEDNTKRLADFIMNIMKNKN